MEGHFCELPGCFFYLLLVEVAAVCLYATSYFHTFTWGLFFPLAGISHGLNRKLYDYLKEQL